MKTFYKMSAKFCLQKSYRFDTRSGIYNAGNNIVRFVNKIWQIGGRNQIDFDMLLCTVDDRLATETMQNLFYFCRQFIIRLLAGFVNKTQT